VARQLRDLGYRDVRILKGGLSSWADAGLPLDAKTESFFFNFTEPQCGHLVPFHSLERTSTSLSRRQSSQ